MTQLIIEGKIVSNNGQTYGQIAIDRDSDLITDVGENLGEADIKTEELIFPGFIDLHVHAREDVSGQQNYKEDFKTASEAALNGGVVHMVEMPNNPVAPIDDAKYKEKEALTKSSLVEVTLYAGIGPNTNPLSFRVPYKAFMGPSVGDLFFSSQAELEQAIKKYEGQNVSFHCEDPEILEENKNAATHEDRRPKIAEVTATDFALYLTEKYNLTAKLCHYSTKEGLPKIIAAKAKGLKVTCEVTPHHLYFDRSMLNEDNKLWLQMNPPLRDPEDRLALIEALRAGEVDYIATDHAPHTEEEKAQGTSGVPHLDTYGAFATWLMAEHNFKPQDIARVCAYNAGLFVNEFRQNKPKYGKIEKGYAGSLTIINPQNPTQVKKENLKTKCGWSPFAGIAFPGSVEKVIVKGKEFTLSH